MNLAPRKSSGAAAKCAFCQTKAKVIEAFCGPSRTRLPGRLECGASAFSLIGRAFMTETAWPIDS